MILILSIFVLGCDRINTSLGIAKKSSDKPQEASINESELEYLIVPSPLPELDHGANSYYWKKNISIKEIFPIENDQFLIVGNIDSKSYVYGSGGKESLIYLFNAKSRSWDLLLRSFPLDLVYRFGNTLMLMGQSNPEQGSNRGTVKIAFYSIVKENRVNLEIRNLYSLPFTFQRAENSPVFKPVISQNGFQINLGAGFVYNFNTEGLMNFRAVDPSLMEGGYPNDGYFYKLFENGGGINMSHRSSGSPGVVFNSLGRECRPQFLTHRDSKSPINDIKIGPEFNDGPILFYGIQNFFEEEPRREESIFKVYKNLCEAAELTFKLPGSLSMVQDSPYGQITNDFLVILDDKKVGFLAHENVTDVVREDKDELYDGNASKYSLVYVVADLKEGTIISKTELIKTQTPYSSQKKEKILTKNIDGHLFVRSQNKLFVLNASSGKIVFQRNQNLNRSLAYLIQTSKTSDNKIMYTEFLVGNDYGSVWETLIFNQNDFSIASQTGTQDTKKTINPKLSLGDQTVNFPIVDGSENVLFLDVVNRVGHTGEYDLELNIKTSNGKLKSIILPEGSYFPSKINMTSEGWMLIPGTAHLYLLKYQPENFKD